MKQHIITLSMLSICTSLFGETPSPGTRMWNIAADVYVLGCEIESKVCGISYIDELNGTFTVLDEIITKECTMLSLVDEIQSSLETYTFDFQGTFTAIEAALQFACTIDSAIDTSVSLLDITQSAFGTPITNELVGTAGYTISTGGQYYLSENIVFNPGSTNLAAITIDADNTVLDFKNKTLSTDGTSGTIGVELITTHTNIVIRDGSISNTDAQGILLNTHSADVTINNMVVKTSAADAGIEFAASCTNIFFNNVAVTGCSEHGIVGNDSSSITLQQCTLNNNGQGASIGSGIKCSNCSVISLFNCSANNNFDDGYTFTSDTTADSISLSECTALGNINHGISFTNIEGSSITNCYSTLNGADGINLTDAMSTSVAYNACESNGRDNIRLATGTSGTQNCYIGQNSLMLTTSVNLREESGGTNNGIYGNYALATSSANNYVSLGSSFINKSTVAQTGAFASPNPTFWNNIDMTTT